MFCEASDVVMSVHLMIILHYKERLCLHKIMREQCQFLGVCLQEEIRLQDD